MADKTLTQQMYENHEHNQNRVRQLTAGTGTQNLLIELMDRLDQLEQSMTHVRDADETTWRGLYDLREKLHEIAEKLAADLDS